MKVNEIFGPTIQGEGKSTGLEVLFLRLTGCNLHCIWCDTPYTWNWVGTPHLHPVKCDPAVEIHEMSIDDILVRLNELSQGKVKALVISGGEPLIQQKELIKLIRKLKDASWWVEIETNGTIPPTPEMIELVDQFNCSPKLSNSGDLEKLRVRSRALSVLATNPNAWFKFVVSCELDIQEIQEYISRFNLQNVFLMPLGKTKEELDKTREMTKALTERLGLQFSDRLHIVMFGAKRAV
jgi:7-carboxy-7-deazaguanine synthase